MEKEFYGCLNDDLNTASLIASLFEHSRSINKVISGQDSLSGNDKEILKNLYVTIINNVLGLKSENNQTESGSGKLSQLMDLLL